MSAALICGISARMGGHQPTTHSLSKQVTTSSFETPFSLKKKEKERKRGSMQNSGNDPIVLGAN